MPPASSELADAGGLLLVDKPAGPTSHDVVKSVRRQLAIRRVGHTGTLDPFATGLLLVCVGRATRLAEYFHRLPKEYDATLRLGVETETHDSEGEVRWRSDAWRGLTKEEVVRTLSAHEGSRYQRPPAYSAKRVEGRRAYRLARAGHTPELEPVAVELHRLELRTFDPPYVQLRARVSTGTYIRALARDLGRALGCGAHLTALRRLAIGPFHVSDALREDRLEELRIRHPAWRSPAEALVWLPVRELNEEEASRVATGQAIPVAALLPASPEPGAAEQAVAMVRRGRLVAVGERRGAELRPRKVLEIA